MPTLAQNIKVARIRADLTVEDAAARAQMSADLYRGYESGARPNPTLRTLFTLADALGVTIETLVAGTAGVVVRPRRPYRRRTNP